MGTRNYGVLVRPRAKRCDLVRRANDALLDRIHAIGARAIVRAASSIVIVTRRGGREPGTASNTCRLSILTICRACRASA